LLDPRASAVLVGRMLRSSSVGTLVSHAQMSPATTAVDVSEPVESVAEPIEIEIDMTPSEEPRRYTIVRSTAVRPQTENDLADMASEQQTAISPIPDQVTPFRGYGLGMMSPA
jgi:hypothetical protein